MKKFLAAASLLAASLSAGSAHASLAGLAGLTAINIYEATYLNPEPVDVFAPTDPRLSARLAPLTAANRDFGHFPGTENYDVFYSDALGNLNANGSYLTIEGNCTVPYFCFNINAVSLTVNGSAVFADILTNAVYGRPGSFTPGSAINAVDGNLYTYTALGDTISMPETARMAITIGFSRFPPTQAVPEPASWAMMLGGFGLAGTAMRLRRSAFSFA